MLVKNKDIQSDFQKSKSGADWMKKSNDLKNFVREARAKITDSALLDSLEKIDSFLADFVSDLDEKIDGVVLDDGASLLSTVSRFVLLEPAFEAHFKRREFQQLVSGFIQEAFDHSKTYTPHSMFGRIPGKLERCLDRKLAREAAEAEAAPAEILEHA